MTHFLSLFSGIGGFDLAAYNCGLRFDRHLFSEIDPYAIKVFQARFPDAEPLGDITKIKKEDLPDGDYIIAGGFPCQDISVAGKGAGLAGSRSGLWFEMLRLISDLRPRFIVVENVGALLVRGIDTVLGTLAKVGYDAEWQIISASSVGAPHRRERVYIVAYPTEGRGQNHQRVQGGIGLEAISVRASGTFHTFGTYELREPRNPNFRYGKHNGLSEIVDRANALGNAIVPQCAEVIFNLPAFDEWRLYDRK